MLQSACGWAGLRREFEDTQWAGQPVFRKIDGPSFVRSIVLLIVVSKPRAIFIDCSFNHQLMIHVER